MVRECESNIIFHFSLLGGESVEICDGVPSTMQSSFILDIYAHSGYFESQTPLKPYVLGVYAASQTYITVYEET